MSLDKLFKGTEASTYSRHPNGSFEAWCKDAGISAFENGKQFLKLTLLTNEGKVPDYRIMIFSDADALKAEHDSDYKEKLIKSIQINKGTLVKLGLVTEDVIKQWSQNEMLKCYASLKGKKIKIKIEDDTRDPKYQRVFLESIIEKSANVVESVKTSVPPFSLDDIPF